MPLSRVCEHTLCAALWLSPTLYTTRGRQCGRNGRCGELGEIWPHTYRYTRINTMMSLRSSPSIRSQHRTFSGQNGHVILGRRCVPKALAESNDDTSSVSRRQLTLAGILVALMPAVAQPAQACERPHTLPCGVGGPMPIVCPAFTLCPPNFFCPPCNTV